MQKRIVVPALAIVTMLMMLVVPAAGAIHRDENTHHPFGHPDFWETWARTDKPVAEDKVDRTWIWSPEPYTPAMWEPYVDSPGDERLVQYFDKSRMEINNPAGLDDDLWYVTNGLLVVEMVDGMVQVGDDEFVEADPAEVNIVGDPGDESGLSPTYADINRYGLRDKPALAQGAAITQTIDDDGTVGNEPNLDDENVTGAVRVQVPEIDHTVASVFWEFMNDEGMVFIEDDADEDALMGDGEYVTEELFQNPYYATGYPITEAYWSRAMVAGTEKWVLWQCFERRCLTYTPGNPAGFLVEMGNVGQHYYKWRYTDGAGAPGEVWAVDIAPLNDSGISGQVYLNLIGNLLTVGVDLSGLEPNQEHPMHLHGFSDGSDASCPPTGAAGDDGVLSLDEGAPYYGPPLLSLLVDDGTFPNADENGDIFFVRTYALDEATSTALGSLADNVVVAHGKTLDGSYVASLPVGCGDIQAGDGGEPEEDVTVSVSELNDSGVTGMVRFIREGNTLTAMVDLAGLEPDQVHPMHLHGFSDGSDASCPPASAAGADDILSLEEGAPYYGPVIVPLYVDGTSFPTANGDGEISFTRSYTLTEEQQQGLGPLSDNVVVIHGMTTDLDQDGDGTPGEYEPGLPVACGDIHVVEPAGSGVFDDVTINMTELNNSDVSGWVRLMLEDDRLTAIVDLSGMEPNQVHPMHVHGNADDTDAECPPAGAAGADGIISLAEGAPYYGPVIVPLYASGTDFPTADAQGNVSFTRVYTLTQEQLDALGSLMDNVVVAHGMTTAFDQDDDGMANEYEAGLPVACGDIAPDGTGVEGDSVSVDLINADEDVIGTAEVTDLDYGLKIVVTADGMVPGTHGVHIHAIGECAPPDFTSAGGHFNPNDTEHPFHAGDLPNMVVGEDGTGELTVVTNKVMDLSELDDPNGSALVVHAGADDYMTDPSGMSGARIACGVIYQAEGGEFGELNFSGVTGAVEVHLDGDQLSVQLTAYGLTPDQIHPIEIHGFANGTDATCPPASAAGADEVLTDAEGSVYYGEKLFGLTPYPWAEANGRVTYDQIFLLSQEQVDALSNLSSLTVVIYGKNADLDGNGTTEYEQELPVACTELVTP